MKKGNCVVLFEYLFEGFRTIQGIHVKTIIKNFIDKFNFPANKIYYIDSNNLNNNIDIPCTCLSFRFLFEHYESGLSDNEIKEMHIVKTAVTFFQEDIEKFKSVFTEIMKSEKKADEYLEEVLFIGQLEKLNDVNWNKVIAEFFVR